MTARELFDRIRNPRRTAKKRSEVPADPGIGRDELLERRDRLARDFVALQWDLGGIVYEMAIRDHFKSELVVSQAAKLQAVDAELAEAERVLKLEQAGAAGTCPACGALHARGAAFCWQCGKDLLARSPATGNGSAPETPQESGE